MQPYSGRHYAFLFQFGDDNGNEIAYERRNGDTTHDEEIQRWFDRGKVEGIRAWNAKFDRAFAEREGFDLPPDGMWHDAMFLAYAINERRSLALANVGKEILPEAATSNQPVVKEWLMKERARRKKVAHEAGEELIEPTYADVPMDIMLPYAIEDITLTRKVCEIYEPTIAQTPDLHKTVEFERHFMDACYAMERRGMPAVREGYVRLAGEVEANIERMEEKVKELAAGAGSKT